METSIDKLYIAIKSLSDLEWIKDAAKNVIPELEDSLKKNLDWTTNLKNNINVTASEEDVIIVMPIYGWFVEKGRKPGKMPPVKAIEGWCVAKNIEKVAAFPIARAIGARGIKARPFIEKSISEVIANNIAKSIIAQFTSALNK